MKITIIEENGFKKQIDIQKAVTRLGSSPANDIQLRSSNVAAFHLQILYSQETPDRAKILNLSGQTLEVYKDGEQTSLPPYLPFEIGHGDELNLPTAQIIFEMPLVNKVLANSTLISAELILPEAIMRPKTTLVGRISLKNEGQQSSCQFEIALSGLPEDCYQIDPIPLMYPGAHEDVSIRFFHHQNRPQAGLQNIVVTVTAPESYPGEQVSIEQGLYVSPVLAQGLEILDDMPAPQTIDNSQEAPVEPEDYPEISETAAPTARQAANPANEPQTSQPPAAPVKEKPSTPSEQPKIEEPEPELAEAAKPVSAVTRPPIPVRPKVVKTPSETFWDD